MDLKAWYPSVDFQMNLDKIIFLNQLVYYT